MTSERTIGIGFFLNYKALIPSRLAGEAGSRNDKARSLEVVIALLIEEEATHSRLQLSS
jgi:hypothetical protein